MLGNLEAGALVVSEFRKNKKQKLCVTINEENAHMYITT